MDEDGGLRGSRGLDDVEGGAKVLLDVRLLHVAHVAPCVPHARLGHARLQARRQLGERSEGVLDVELLAQTRERGRVGEIAEVEQPREHARRAQRPLGCLGRRLLGTHEREGGLERRERLAQQQEFAAAASAKQCERDCVVSTRRLGIYEADVTAHP